MSQGMMYSVYMHIFPNGKRYIGITKMKPSERWHGGSGYRKQPKMYAAIKKYGWENVEHFILMDGLTQGEAEKKEKQFIKEFNTIESGYNVDAGGCGAYPRSKEFKDSLSVCNAGENNPFFGKHHSEENKKKHSEFMKGNAFFKGHHHSDDFKKMKSKQMSEKYANGGNPKCKKVCMTTREGAETVFYSLRKAAETADVSVGTMHKLIHKGIIKNGCTWRYINEAGS